MSVAILWLGLFIAALTFYGLRLPQRWRFSHIPGPRPYWLLGNTPDVLRLGQHTAYAQWAKLYGPVFRVHEGAQTVVVVADAALARQYASRCIARHHIPYLETGEEAIFNRMLVLWSRGAWWRSVRSAWQPFFHAASLEGFSAQMNEAAGRLVALLEGAAISGQPLDLAPRLGDLTLGVVGRCAFGVDFRTQAGAATQASGNEYEAEAAELVGATRAFFEQAGPAIMSNPYILLLMAFPPLACPIRWLANVLPTAPYRRARAARATMKRIVQALLDDTHPRNSDNNSIAAARKSRGAGATAAAAPSPEAAAGGGAKDASAERRGGAAPGSFLHLMMRSVNKETGRPFTDTEVVAQAYGFLLAGYETTASAIGAALHLLAAHPAAEARLLAEVDSFGRERAPSQADALGGRFPYAEAVMKEVLRLYPPVPLMAREAPEGLRLGGLDVPKGAWVQTSLYCLHRDGRYWRDPGAFLPGRFLRGEPEAGRDDLAAYMPWGGGPRACAGVRFATLEFVTVLVRLYQRYTFALVPGSHGSCNSELRVKMGLTLAPESGVRLQVHRRRRLPT